MDIATTLIIAAFLGLIPAFIAKNKGYNFLGWWFYGWMLFIVALIHSLCLKDKNAVQANPAPVMNGGAEELRKYKELLDTGAITQDEYDAKKKQILGL